MLEVEALFPWGSTLVHVDAPFGASDSFPERAGATVTEPGYIELAAGLPRRTVMLRNTGPRDVWISSHFPLDQVNPAVVVAGGLAVGCPARPARRGGAAAAARRVAGGARRDRGVSVGDVVTGASS